MDLDLTTGDETFVVGHHHSVLRRDRGRDFRRPDRTASSFNHAQRRLKWTLAAFRDSRVQLTDLLAATNVLRIVADCAYMSTGEGLHRFVDPVDKAVYLYTQFEVIDARRMFACFDQPDLKATFAFNVTAPDDWEVISNSPTPEPETVSTGHGPLGVRRNPADVDLHHRADRRAVRTRFATSTAESRWLCSAASRWSSTSTPSPSWT